MYCEVVVPLIDKSLVKEIRALGFSRKIAGLWGHYDWPDYPRGIGKDVDFDGARVGAGYLRIIFAIQAASIFDPDGGVIDIWTVGENSVKMEYITAPDEFRIGDNGAILSAVRTIVIPWINRMSDYQELISYLSNMYEYGVPDDLNLRADIEPSIVGGYRIERPRPMKGAPGLIGRMGMVHEAFGQKNEAVRCYSEFMQLMYPEKERLHLHPKVKKDIAKREELIRGLAGIA